MKISFAAILIVSMFLSSSFLQYALAQPTTVGASSGKGYCDEKCGMRCSNAGVNDRCLKYCGLCCQHCNCVPSGTYGNKSECPCYRDMLNSKGKSKCP